MAEEHTLDFFKKVEDLILPGGGNVPPPLYGIPNIPYPRSVFVAGHLMSGSVIFHGPFREYTRLVVDNNKLDVDIWIYGEGRDVTESIPVRAERERVLDFPTPTNEDGTLKERLAFYFFRLASGSTGDDTIIWVE